MQSWGPFAPNAGVRAHIAFRHAIEGSPPPAAAELAARTERKLLFWARPERNTARNLFELSLAALREACASGLFPRSSWRLHAIGCAAYAPMPLPGGQRLEFLGRLAHPDYVRALPTYDVGLVPMFSPHPSVPNFELAAAGVPTVTTAFSNRPKAAMESACPNLVVCEASVEAMTAALAEAAQRALDGSQRLIGAQFDWPRDWRDVFDHAWLARFTAELADALGAATAQRLMAAAGR
jgi:glycosyltransferase involved in cell wall biosynthesis